MIKGLEAILLPSKCTGDLAIVKIRLPDAEDLEKKMVLASGYFPYNSQIEPPPREVQDLVDTAGFGQFDFS